MVPIDERLDVSATTGTARRPLRVLLRHGEFRAGAIIAVVLFAIAVFGASIARNPNAVDYAEQLVAPSRHHLLGTDGAGRDLLARTIAGIRTSLGAAVLVMVLTSAIGLIVGGVAAFIGGPIDALLSRLIDVMLGLPSQVVALAIVGALGVGERNLILAVTVTSWAELARLSRSIVLDSRSRLDIAAARMAGIRPLRIFTGHVLPGQIAQTLVISASGFGSTVLTLAGLSFLGLGAQPPTAELGQMLADSRGDLGIAPWLLIGPGVALVATMAAALLIGDSLRDALDPIPPLARRKRGRESRRRRSRTTRGVVASATSPAVVDLRGLHVRYPDGTAAVRGVDLTVADGERVAIVGESGCGKTTVARALLGMLPDGSTITGTVTLDGHDVLNADDGQLRKLRGPVAGYVAQDPFAACDPLQRVARHLDEPWRAHGMRPPPGEAVRRVTALGLANASDRLRQRPHEWSGGMLQRATTAAAAVHDPRLIIADEPTSALDTELADGSLSALTAASDALLLISHDLRLVAEHTDRTAVMYAGRIIELGPTADVTSVPRHPYSRALLAASPVAGGGVPATLPGAPPSLRHDPVGCPFAPRCAHRSDECETTEPTLIDGVACWNAG